MSMDHKDWLKEQTERSPEMHWEREDIMMNNQALRLKVQFMTLENEKQRERILALEQEIAAIKKNAMEKLGGPNGWGKGKDE